MTTAQTTDELIASFEKYVDEQVAELGTYLATKLHELGDSLKVNMTDAAAELAEANNARVAELEAQLAERDERIAQLEESNTEIRAQSTERIRGLAREKQKLNRLLQLAADKAVAGFKKREAETAEQRVRAEKAENQAALLRAEVAEQANSLSALQNELETVRGMPGDTAQPWSAYEPGIETELLVPQIVAAEPVPDGLAAFRTADPLTGHPAGLELAPVGAAATGNGASRSDEPTKSRKGAWLRLNTAAALLMAFVIPSANSGRRAPKQKSGSRSRWTALKEWGNAEEPLFTRGRSGPGKETS